MFSVNLDKCTQLRLDQCKHRFLVVLKVIIACHMV
ncbi:hypothetical protein Clow_02010 [Corynebacterium lowii]|uniref:Uncharacterized protein n=1 Tax=Corynebacterium lowii TaxID=1544413 RepID=A0A0Q0YEG3_9CORY|nr:hypothetical protein Clow_02010 [Corynebacterium lowii]